MRTVDWQDDRLVLIDQRRIPWSLELVYLDDHTAAAAAIADMTVRGAPAIGATAAFGMALAARNARARSVAELFEALQAAGEMLKAARPTAVNLAWAVDRMMRRAHALAEMPVDEITEKLLEEALCIADEDVAINRRMGAHGAALIRDGDTILHHCNTGALATVDYGTALGVIRAAHEQGKRIHVLLDETRPRLQGARLSAWELEQLGISYDIIADTAAGYYLRSGEVNIVMFGADRVAANGDVANKIGTYQIAVLAKENAVPVYAVVPTSTIDLSLRTGDEIPIEQRSKEEVIAPFGTPIVPAHYRARNPAFDVTPYRYLTGIVTENGIALPPLADSLARAVAGEKLA